MRHITEIIIHCSATPEEKDFTVADIDRWHRERGFNCIGYHYVIYLDGSIHEGRPISQIGAHCKGHNSNSVGICYIGGTDKSGKSKDTRTPEQTASIRNLVDKCKKLYPDAQVYGHNEFAPKDCPCFDVKKEFRK